MIQELKVQQITQEGDQVTQNLAKLGCLMKGQEFSDLHRGLDNTLSVILRTSRHIPTVNDRGRFFGGFRADLKFSVLRIHH
jgi:hypothetical protein